MIMQLVSISALILEALHELHSALRYLDIQMESAFMRTDRDELVHEG